MPTFCAANRCTNNSNKGYSVFNFPSNEELRQKWIAALGKGSDWRPTFQRICEVHFNSVDIQLVAGRKQLCENAIPCHFCVCPYDKETNKKNKLRKKSTKPFETADHAYCSEKKSLPLQLRSSNNTLPHTYISEHNYFAHTGKENKEYFIKEVSNDAKKKLGLVNSERNRHVDHCPLLRSPISIDQLWTESNMDINQNESNLDMNHNELDINSRQALISKIDTLSKDNENLKLKLNEIRMTQTRKINDQDAKLKEVTADNKALKKQLEKLNQQIIRINSSVDKLTSRPSQYSDKSIIKGLSLWTACGTSGYNRVRKAFDVELPAPRTLQRKIQNISFNPGILEDIFLCLESRINNMEERSKLCCLVFDEMSIEPKIEYDRGSDSNMGYCTLPALPIAASKALLFLIAGVYKRYKQVLAYHFTSTSTDSATVKDFILSLLEKCETSGLHVLVLVCDMGNRGILNQLGFSCRKNDIQYSIQHPFNKKEKLFALPDVVHVFKNLKEMLMKIGIITLPDELVREYGLPTETIDMNLIEWLDEQQSDMGLKFAPKLKKKNIKANHFKKMKVYTTTSVLNEQTASGLFRYGELLQDPIMITTATRISNSSYDHDDSPTLISLMQKIERPKQTSELSIKLPKLQDCPSLSLEEEETLYKMCGYVLRKLQSSIKCKVCYNSLLHQGPVDHPKAGLLLVCEFVEAALVRVSDEVYQILHGAESIIMASENIMKDLGGSLKCTLESHIMKELSSFPLSTCHDQRQTLISRFLSMRLHQLLPCPKSNQNTAFASKSMGSRLLADAFNPRPR